MSYWHTNFKTFIEISGPKDRAITSYYYRVYAHIAFTLEVNSNSIVLKCFKHRFASMEEHEFVQWLKEQLPGILITNHIIIDDPNEQVLFKLLMSEYKI